MAGGLIGAAIAAVKARATEIGTAAGAAVMEAAAAELPGAAPAPTGTGATGPASPPRTVWAFFVRAWRPFCGWMIGVLLLRSAVVPIVQLIREQPVEPTDWTALAAMAGVLFITRSYERSQGIA